MRPMIRSLFLLSLAAAPLAIAGTPAKAVTPEVVSAAVSDTTGSSDVASVVTKVLDLEATLNGMRHEIAQLREQEAVARTRGFSEPVDQFNWNQF